MLTEKFLEITCLDSRKTLYKRLMSLKAEYQVDAILGKVRRFMSLGKIQTQNLGIYNPVGVEYLTFIGIGFDTKPHYLFKLESGMVEDVYIASLQDLKNLHFLAKEDLAKLDFFNLMLSHIFHEYLKDYDKELESVSYDAEGNRI